MNAALSDKQLPPDILKDTITSLFSHKKIINSDKITISLPLVADPGAAVPITVTSTYKDVKSIAILVEKNPVPLAATFHLSEDLDAFVSTRFKIAASSDVIVLIETNDAFYRAKASVKMSSKSCGN